MSQLKIVFLFLIFLFFVFFFYFGLNKYFDINFFVSKKQQLDSLYENSPVLFVLAFFSVYVLCATFSIPGAAILTLVSGFIFGFFMGSVVVSVGSTLGATFSFLISRYLLRDFIQKKFHSRLKKINEGIEKNGAFYLFSLRLVPVFPFFAVNAFMGVTSIPVKQFFVASFLGMLPGTLVYVNAGTQLSDIKSPAEIISLPIILSFLLLACLPWIMKFLLRLFSIKVKNQLKEKN